MVKKEAQEQAERKQQRETRRGSRGGGSGLAEQSAKAKQMGQMGKRAKCEIKSRQYYTLYFCHITKWHFLRTNTHREIHTDRQTHRQTHTHIQKQLPRVQARQWQLGPYNVTHLKHIKQGRSRERQREREIARERMTETRKGREKGREWAARQRGQRATDDGPQKHIYCGCHFLPLPPQRSSYSLLANVI